MISRSIHRLLICSFVTYSRSHPHETGHVGPHSTGSCDSTSESALAGLVQDLSKGQFLFSSLGSHVGYLSMMIVLEGGCWVEIVFQARVEKMLLLDAFRSFVCLLSIFVLVSSSLTSNGISKAQNGIRSRSSHCVSSATYTSEAKLDLVSPSSKQPKRFGRTNVTLQSLT